MSAANAIGDFDLNAIQLRKKLEFPDGSIQTTAYTGSSGGDGLADVLADGNDADGQNILGVGTLEVINITASPTTTVKPATQARTTIPILQVQNDTRNINLTADTTGGEGNPMVQSGDNTIISASGIPLTLTSQSATTDGIRLTSSAVEIGAGGTGIDPAQRIAFNNPANTLQMIYTNLGVTTGALPATSGASASLFFPITINGVAYKIALNLA